MARLILRGLKGERKSLPLKEGKNSLGRSSENDIVLESKLISRQHAYVEKREEEFFLVDLDSMNGTYLNGLTTKNSLLVDQDLIRIGPFQLLYEVKESQPVTFTARSSRKIVREVSPPGGTLAREEEWLGKGFESFLGALDGNKCEVLLVDPHTGGLVHYLSRGEGEEIGVSELMKERVLNQKRGLLLEESNTEERYHSLIAFPLFRNSEALGMLLIGRKGDKRSFGEEELNLCSLYADYLTMGLVHFRYRDSLVEESRVVERLKRFHPQPVVEAMMRRYREKGEGEPGLIEQDTTVIVVKIDRFDLILSELGGIRSSAVLNEYYSLVTEILFSQLGTLDKYMGETIIGFFGAPYSAVGQGERAVKAAKEIQKVMGDFGRRMEGSPSFSLKIGVQTGNGVVGNVGAPARLEYTVVGSVFWEAMEICDLCEGGKIFLGERVVKLLKGSVPLKERGPFGGRDRSKEKGLYELV